MNEMSNDAQSPGIAVLIVGFLVSIGVLVGVLGTNASGTENSYPGESVAVPIVETTTTTPTTMVDTTTTVPEPIVPFRESGGCLQVEVVDEIETCESDRLQAVAEAEAALKELLEYNRNLIENCEYHYTGNDGREVCTGATRILPGKPIVPARPNPNPPKDIPRAGSGNGTYAPNQGFGDTPVLVLCMDGTWSDMRFGYTQCPEFTEWVNQ